MIVTSVTSLFVGCTAEEQIPEAKTKEISAYGLTLDADAPPEQVVYVLLRSLKDDVEASQSFKHAEQKEALDRTFALAAHSEIEQRLLALVKSVKKDVDLGDERDEKLFEIVDKWAPIVAHYVDSFDTDASAAAAKMKRRNAADGKLVHIYYPVTHEASATEPEQVLDIELVKEPADDTEYWRVVRIDYVPKAKIPSILEPTTTTAPR
jgi:hypothetical protein